MPLSAAGLAFAFLFARPTHASLPPFSLGSSSSTAQPAAMAYVTLTNITVLDNPTAFTNPFQFEVTFECAQALEAGAC